MQQPPRLRNQGAARARPTNMAVAAGLHAALRGLPGTYQDEVRDYVMHGERPANVILQIASGDAFGALAKMGAAKEVEFLMLLRFFVREAPALCAGNPVDVERWMHRGGLKGPRVLKAVADG